MNRGALHKDILIEISKSKTRFLSIMVMIALGVAIFVGLCVTGPTMRHTLFSYTENYPLPDLSVSSPLGLEVEDQVILSQIPGLSQIDYSYRVDLMIQGSDVVLMAESLSDFSPYEVVEGRLPHKVKELALDAHMMGKGYEIGDEISFVPQKFLGNYPLKAYTYTITGFVNSSEYLMPSQKGSSSVGDGVIDCLGLILAENFQMDNYSIARMNFTDVAAVDSYSQEYKDKMANHKKVVEAAVEERPEVRLDQYHRDAMEEIEEGREKISDAEREIVDADQELADARRKLRDGWSEYYDGKATFDKEIADAKQEILEAEEELMDAKVALDTGHLKLTSGERDLEKGKADLRKGEEELADGKKKLDDGEKQLKDAQREIDRGRAELAKNTNEVNAGLAQVKAGLEQVKKEMDKIKGLISPDDANKSIKEIASALTSIEAAVPTAIEQIEPRIVGIYTAIGGIDYQLNEIEEELIRDPGSEALKVEKSILSARKDILLKEQGLLTLFTYVTLKNQQAYLLTQEKSLLDALPVLDEGRRELSAGQRKLDQELATFEEKKKEYEVAVLKLEKGRQEIKNAEAELREARLELTDGYRKYNNGLRELEEGRLTFEEEKEKGEQELKDAYVKLLEGEQDYREGFREYEDKVPDAQKDIASGKADIKDAEKELSRLKVPRYTIQGKYDNPGYFQYIENSESMDLLSYIFPVFFFLIALLVSLTTMTRMVDEHRLLIGTIKALGYSNLDIAKKYLIYGSCASLMGCVLGILAGQKIIMPVIFTAYSSSFLFEGYEALLPLRFSVIAIIISLLCTSFAAFMTIRSSLANNVATLLRPKVPKLGNRILLERISFIWTRLSFNYKVTARNIFRYKKRMLMTIIGVAGCTALVFMGFGIRDSIGDILPKQYQELFRYDTIILFDDDGDQQELALYKEGLEKDKRISKSYPVRFEQGSISIPGMLNQSVSIVIPEDPETFHTINRIQDRRSGEAISLEKEAVISEKLAQLLKLKEGDSLAFSDSNDVLKTIRISGITENYAGHFLYLSPHYYEEIFDKAYRSNGHFMTLKDNQPEAVTAFSIDMLEDDLVLRTVNTNTSSDVIEDLMASMNIVVLVIIIASSLLAIVVLYNLTNINVSERIRELCTIKVLGFYPEEVTSYVYRETTLLTLIGIFVGYILGLLLHYFITTALSPSNVMMSPEVHLGSYLLSAAITLAFSLVVMLIMHRRLKCIDMVESLKAVE